MHGLHWPDSVLSYVVVALALGFPLVVTLASIFDVKQGRIERAAPARTGKLRGVRLGLVLVGIGVAAAAPGTIWYFFVRGIAKPLPAPAAGTEAVTPSIAVLSFVDMSPGHDQEYFADGVAEEILNALAHVEGLRVPGRTSCFYFKGKSAKLADIGRELRVGNVLEGSLRKDGSRVRITAQLVRVEDEMHLWSETYERELTGVFAVQDEIARDVVDALKLKLSPQNARAGAPTRNTEAYTEYLLGRQLFYALHTEESLQHFERAIALDSNSAPAWGFLSIAVTQLAVNAGRASAEVRDRASAAAERAIALAPEESVGYVARAFLRNFVLWDWPGAQADAERALTLPKSYVNPDNQYALLLLKMGRTREAIEFGRKARDLDPLNTIYWQNLAAYYRSAGELGLARAALTRRLEISPDRPIGSRLAVLDLLSGSVTEALAGFERFPDELAGIAMAKHDLGRATESQQALDALIARDGSKAAYDIAEVHAWCGDRDRAFEWLERAYDQHDLSLSYVKADPLLRNLRDDPRFKVFLKKMKLPVD